MTPVVVSKSAIRDLVNEALDGGHLGDLRLPEDPPIMADPVVDPSAAQTDPLNALFVPQTKPELDVAVKELTKDVPIGKVPAFYKALEAALDTGALDTEEEKKMKKLIDKQQVENVRRTVRGQLKKMLEASQLPPIKKIPFGVHGSEYMARFQKSRDDLASNLARSRFTDSSDDRDEEEDLGPKRAYKATAIGGMNDVSGASFETIAKELSSSLRAEAEAELAAAKASGDKNAMKAAQDKKTGSSVAGAKRVADEALTKARFLAQLDDDDREIMVLTAMNDYIAMLRKSGELSAADVQLMKDHPNIVGDLDGFREFFHTVAKRAMRGKNKLENPLGEAATVGTKPTTSASKKDDMQSCPDCEGKGWDEKADADCELCVGHGQMKKRDLHGEALHRRKLAEALVSVGVSLKDNKRKRLNRR
jgi:hypothetical protein